MEVEAGFDGPEDFDAQQRHAEVRGQFVRLDTDLQTLRADVRCVSAKLDRVLALLATQSAHFPEQPGSSPRVNAHDLGPLSREISIDRGESTDVRIENETELPRENAKLDEPGKPTPLDVMELWNRVASPSLPRCRNMKGKRGQMAREKLKDYSLTDMEQALSAMNMSPFHKGQNQSRWVANIDYFLRGTILQQFLEKWEAPAPATPYFKPGSLYGSKS